jgi:hypothetical protein
MEAKPKETNQKRASRAKPEDIERIKSWIAAVRHIEDVNSERDEFKAFVRVDGEADLREFRCSLGTLLEFERFRQKLALASGTFDLDDGLLVLLPRISNLAWHEMLTGHFQTFTR